jgi:hypothetical protein
MESIRALLGLPARLGRLLTAPDEALAQVEAEGGGLRDALALVVAAVVAFRLPELVHAVLMVAGPTSGAFMRLLALFGDEARHAAWFVLPAAVVVTLLAGNRRDAGRDLDLGAACYPAAFVVFGLERALSALTGPRPFYRSAADAVAGVAVALLVWRAGSRARARPVSKAPPHPPRRRPRHRSRPRRSPPRSPPEEPPGPSPPRSRRSRSRSPRTARSGARATSKCCARSRAGSSRPSSRSRASTASPGASTCPRCAGRSSCSTSGRPGARRAWR